MEAESPWFWLTKAPQVSLQQHTHPGGNPAPSEAPWQRLPGRAERKHSFSWHLFHRDSEPPCLAGNAVIWVLLLAPLLVSQLFSVKNKNRSCSWALYQPNRGKWWDFFFKQQPVQVKSSRRIAAGKRGEVSGESGENKHFGALSANPEFSSFFWQPICFKCFVSGNVCIFLCAFCGFTTTAPDSCWFS